MIKKISALAAIAVVALPVTAMAAKVGDNKAVNFNGTVTHTCSITVGSGGTMVANANNDLLTGSGGTATIAATGNTFKLHVDAPSMAAGNPVAATSTTSTVTGDLTTDDTDNAGANVTRGSHAVNIAMTAAATFFEEGDYSATVTLRCE